MPNTQARWICGANGTNYLVGEYKTAGLPNITAIGTGYWRNETISNPQSRAAYTLYDRGEIAGSGSVNESTRTGCFNASLSNSIYGNSETVRPRSVVINFCIKF